MSEKLSERLDIAATIHEDMAGKDCVIAATIREAARIVRAVEEAPECVVESVKDFDDAERPILNVLIKLGKRVKLVEVK